ncbi:MAG: RHS repeat-associated core domain-containing protein [Flavobacteriales bacterium]|nr:RHS repeat-associated core domain-containing protein [Flavobacteriales bacterium]
MRGKRGVDTGLYYYGARYYNPTTSLWLSVDPLAEQTMQSYIYVSQNPMNLIDPTGMSGESTHIDEEGNVIAVINDGDKGVYQHKNNADGRTPTEYMIEKRQEKHGASANGTKIGETEYWDEFINPDDGTTMTHYKIQVGKSFDPIIKEMHKKAESMDLIDIGKKSSGGGDFDIKIPYKNVGAKLNGKYATSRSAGNFLAGYNAQGGELFGVSISFKTFQKLAGALHIEESKGKKLNRADRADIVIFGRYYRDYNIPEFKPPTYGEVMYQYRMSKAGWEFGQNQKK